MKVPSIGLALLFALRIAALQAEEVDGVPADKDAAALFSARVLARIDLLPTITHAEKERLHDLLTRSRNLSRLFTIHFETSNARLVPSEVGALKQRLLDQQVQTWLSDPNVVLLVLGFGDRPIPKSRDFDVAGSRAQSVTNFLREQCGVQQTIYSLSMREDVDQEAEQGEMARRVAEVWALKP